jgi:hypothetical protein
VCRTGRHCSIRNREALPPGLLAQRVADRLVEGLVALLAVLLQRLLDVLGALLAQLGDFLLDGLALGQLLLDVGDALGRPRLMLLQATFKRLSDPFCSRLRCLS